MIDIEDIKRRHAAVMRGEYGIDQIINADVPALLSHITALEGALSAAQEELEEEKSWWPKWGLEIKAILERHGYDYTFTDEINLPGDLEDWIEEWTAADRAKQTDLEAQLSTIATKAAKAVREEAEEAVMKHPYLDEDVSEAVCDNIRAINIDAIVEKVMDGSIERPESKDDDRAAWELKTGLREEDTP